MTPMPKIPKAPECTDRAPSVHIPQIGQAESAAGDSCCLTIHLVSLVA
jgi:hypothetical protein